MLKKLLTGIAIAAVSATTAFAGGHSLDGKSWDQIVAQAKEEGEVTWYVWYLQDRLRAAVKPFEEKYGIKVTIPEGTRQANTDKVLAESGRETGDVDVFANGFNRFDGIDVKGLFMQLDMLPEDAGRVGTLTGIDGQGAILAFWGNQTGIAYDPGKVDESKLPQTAADFEAFWAANPGKFGFNYVKGGSGQSYIHNMFRTLTDVDFYSKETDDAKIAALQPAIDFFNKSAENYVITASNADSVTRLSDGELWMVPGWEDHVAGLQKNGTIRKELKFYVPSMGMNGGGNGVTIPKNAPRPAAAAVFIDWLTSAETQTAFNEEFGTAPMNANASGAAALVADDQRQYRTPWPTNPFRKALEEHFTENVVLER